MKLDKNSIDALNKELYELNHKVNLKKNEIIHLYTNRINEVAGIIIESLGYKAYDHKGNMLYTVNMYCNCLKCNGDFDDFDAECNYDDMETIAENHIAILDTTRYWESLTSGKTTYNNFIPREFLYMEDQEIRDKIAKEITDSYSRKLKSKQTREKNKKKAEDAKKAALAKLTKEELKALGIK